MSSKSVLFPAPLNNKNELLFLGNKFSTTTIAIRFTFSKFVHPCHPLYFCVVYAFSYCFMRLFSCFTQFGGSCQIIYVSILVNFLTQLL